MASLVLDNMHTEEVLMDMQIAELQDLSEEELQKVIEEARKTLETKTREKREQVIAQINELAESVGLEVEIRDKKAGVSTRRSRKGIKVPIKYRHPSDPSLTWTGRGQMPRWMRELVEQGHDREEFRIHD